MNCSSFSGHGNCKQIVKFPWSKASASPALWPGWAGEPLAHPQAGADAATPLRNKPEAGPADTPGGRGLCWPAAGRLGSKSVRPPTMAPRLPAPAFPDPSRRSPSLRGACPAISPTHRLETGRPAAILRPTNIAPSHWLSHLSQWGGSVLAAESSWQPAALSSAFKLAEEKWFVSSYLFSLTVFAFLLVVS